MNKLKVVGIGLLLSAIFGAIQTIGQDTSSGAWMYTDMTTHITHHIGFACVLIGTLTKQPAKHDTTSDEKTTSDKVSQPTP